MSTSTESSEKRSLMFELSEEERIEKVLHKIMRLESGAGIQTHELVIMGLLSYCYYTRAHTLHVSDLGTSK